MTEYMHTDDPVLAQRRERVFLVLAGLFLGTLAMLNILGISRFIKLFTLTFGSYGEVVFAVAVGVLPYPLTFLCTDLISELYGRKRANFVVFVGLILNIWVIFILWIGGLLPGFETLDANGAIALDAAGRLPIFYEVRALTFGAVTASMIAYLAAQFTDVYMFHFWKRLTKGRHLWLRNNGSTLISQIVDSTAVILVTHYYAHALPIDVSKPVMTQLLVFIASGYTFKMLAALIDTGPFYIGVHYLSRYLQINPMEEHEVIGSDIGIEEGKHHES